MAQKTSLELTYRRLYNHKLATMEGNLFYSQ